MIRVRDFSRRHQTTRIFDDCAYSPNPCGPTGAPTKDVGTQILEILSTAGGIFGAMGLLGNLFGEGLAAIVPDFLKELLSGVGPAETGALAGAAGVVFIVGAFAYKRCWEEPTKVYECVAGIVDQVVRVNFYDVAENIIFPFTAMHDRMDVVVKSKYWPKLEQNAAYVYCNEVCSPILLTFFHTELVCRAVWGSLIGSVVGGVGGFFAGAKAGAELAAVCLAGGPLLAPFCLILGAIVACVVAAACALVGAFLGGNIVRGGDVMSPTRRDETLPETREGDYVVVRGPLVHNGEFGGARTMWFAEEIVLHGREAHYSRPFAHTLPEEKFSGENEEKCYEHN